MAYTLRAAVVLAAAGLLAAGCGSGETPLGVSGKVTFNGEPVTEGSVQFNDEKTGRGAQVDLKADGSYTATLYAAEYKVVVTPPSIEDTANGPPSFSYKKVKNIPVQYHSTATSGLRAMVAPGKTTHDFELKP